MLRLFPVRPPFPTPRTHGKLACPASTTPVSDGRAAACKAASSGFDSRRRLLQRESTRAAVDVFSEYEVEVVQLMLTPVLGAVEVDWLVDEARFVSLEFSGVGYFLTVTHPIVPKERLVVSQPNVSGRLGELWLSFVLFLEDGELMFECVSCDAVPETVREEIVHISRNE